ncbi:SRPBCC family protein [Fulvivirga sp. M361]|uniref:SRPBCC family protein n=1 Tax=Fulvivirga sp. M361 TaxID=2594266 RepID=UPI00117B16AC|nr:SRPBCC family protein [Fulvivirga sp. M361]TRX49214.1 SRPBCC family protein [Fulvivirga sp. M361]
MKVLKVIGIILAVVVVIFAATFFIVSSGQPAEGNLESSIVISASPETIYEEAVNIKKLDAWSPWYAMDPGAYTYEGPEEGVGATSKWSSENPELGIGSLKIIEAVENKSIKTQMKFEGFNGNFSSYLNLEPAENGTKVVWGYNYKDIDQVGRFFMGLMDVNEEMMPMFEKGLSDLKQIAEAKPVPTAEVMEPVTEASDSTIAEE